MLSKLRALVALFVLTHCTSCVPTPTVSAPKQTRIQTDAGPLVCEYMQATENGRSFYVGVCAPDDKALNTAVALVKAAYPVVETLYREARPQ